MTRSDTWNIWLPDQHICTIEGYVSAQTYHHFEEPGILQQNILPKHIPTLLQSPHYLFIMTVEQPNSVFITGLAHKYPPYSQTREDFALLVNTLVPEHSSSPG